MNLFKKNNSLYFFLYFLSTIIFIIEASKTQRRKHHHHIRHHQHRHHHHHQHRHHHRHRHHGSRRILGEPLTGPSKAEQMCTKYTTQACKIPTPSRQLKNKIVNGQNAKAKEYPHMTAIGYGKAPKVDWTCGGSLISENFVMTAGHCAQPRIPTLIRLGELDLASTKDDAKPIDYEIIKIIVHPNYKASPVINDIALLKFKGVSAFTNYIRPICLNVVQNIPNQKLLAIGWGTSKFTDQKGISNLQSVELDLQSDDKCKGIFKDYNTSSMLCVGYAPGGKDTCRGDSGGPLQILNKKAKCTKVPIYTQIGIVSAGKKCGLPKTPAKYTKVSFFIPWIEKNVWN